MQPDAENLHISAQTGGFGGFHVKAAPIWRANK
jgi:hypothetical protein